MVEEVNPETAPVAKTKMARPKPVYMWTVADTLKWLRRHCSERCAQYQELFQRHEITGRALLRITDDSLYRMGILDEKDRDDILREIIKQILKTDIMEIRDMELMNNVYQNCI
ncbi:protein aveugle isoform X2 [Anopheles cruzii]|uniref:protein aveugle isoform X2 n=1 Tax=Anopheles cruzii TaxID=68878 RepID=UPI0022EC83D2|nr:protein aveugle isoform X2 [Anopheles cruzii]